ncbi:AAA family ATPase [Acidovorax sp. LjRoot118]|uniref:ATP-binding protein n=1 Tax=Acidovorax sp. LjRoot118 TaxID=3342256 RepID=UPI003ECF6BA7
MDKNSSAKSLHLHSVESLLFELIGGGSVSVGSDGEVFSLPDASSRAIMNWYAKNRLKWASNVQQLDIEAIVASPSLALPEPVAVTVPAAGPKSSYTLTRLQAHRFAGIHVYGTKKEAPKDFDFEISPSITILEGFNGAGKTSLLNAVVWCLTGMLLRPQRAPERSDQEFSFELLHEGDNEVSNYKSSPVTPLPPASMEKLEQSSIPIDTWVELTLRETGTGKLHQVRRTQTRTPRGKIEETPPNFASLGLDSHALRIGTVIPALLPFSQLGSQSELGKAVAQLTGLAPFTDLAKHVKKVRERIGGEETKARRKDIEKVDAQFSRSLEDLNDIAAKHPELEIAAELPSPTVGSATEAALKEVEERLQLKKASALSAAQSILGADFNPEAQGQALEHDVIEARISIEALKTSESARRLSSLRKLTTEEKSDARSLIAEALSQAQVLLELSQSSDKAARHRIYAAIAQWYSDHGMTDPDLATCIVCGGDLVDAIDPVTGLSVQSHLSEALEKDFNFVSQTLERWSNSTVAHFSSALGETLAAELKRDLSDKPFQLIRQALVDETLSSEAFQGPLFPLVQIATAACDARRDIVPGLELTTVENLSQKLPEMPTLQRSIIRLDTALRTSDWAQTNGTLIHNFTREVVGLVSQESPLVPTSLRGRLRDLEKLIESVEPLNTALRACGRLKADLEERRALEARLEAYSVADASLAECFKLGALAEKQVDSLQNELHSVTEIWRKTIYQAGYPNANHDLKATSMKPDGQLEFRIGSDGASAPAQHVANASALRATLIAFYFAYWDYMRKERGGLNLVVLDDPQELLDGDNKERLAGGLVKLVAHGAQPFLTTHDKKFAGHVVRECQAAQVLVEHRDVHPATWQRPTLATAPSVLEVAQAKKNAVDSHWTVPAFAQDYAAKCREFIEARLGDFFDDIGKPASASHNLKPTLGDFANDLKSAVKAGSIDLFKSKHVVALSKDPALDPKSTTWSLLNNSHHHLKTSITPTQVSTELQNLDRLCDLVESAHQDFRTFCRREPHKHPTPNLEPLYLEQIPKFNLPIQPSLKAFVLGSAYGGSQETELETLSSDWFEDKAAFFLRTMNFGFASTVQSVAIVEATASEVSDRSLVIARRENVIFARRLHRSKHSSYIGLATETPDPRSGRNTVTVNASEVALHQVKGMLFHVDVKPTQQGNGEAEQVDLGTLLKRVKSAYQVKKESAVPLALEGQTALGGETLGLSTFDQWLDHYVALKVSDETMLFKRVGKALPGDLGHLRQFETIGGLGVSDVFSVGKPHPGFAQVESAVLILGVLYTNGS